MIVVDVSLFAWLFVLNDMAWEYVYGGDSMWKYKYR